MKVMVTGHRIQKLQNYNLRFINDALIDLLEGYQNRGIAVGMAGMASGVDLWFGETCHMLGIPFWACIPFDGQEETMSKEDATSRDNLIRMAAEVKAVKNSWMVENCDEAIVVWDGNKGGTHNVFQQLVEKNKNFFWVNPVGKKIIPCF